MIYRKDTVSLLQKIRNILISVATGSTGSTSSSSYIDLYDDLTSRLESFKLENPIPYETLEEWRGKWSSGDLPSYYSRREHVRSLVDPLINYLQEGPTRREAIPDPTGWDDIDRVQDKIRRGLASGSDEEDFQNVGLLCREVLVTLAQLVVDPDQHPPLEDIETSPTDVKRLFAQYLVIELPGKRNKEARKYVRASVDLANKLQHNRNASFRDAALCAQATISVVNFIAILSHDDS